VIFLTLGTHQPFDRLVEIVDRWSGGRPDVPVFGQIPEPGRTGYRPRHFEWVAHLKPADYRRRFENSRFVVAHAGMGSIITAQSLSKPIVIFPRRAALREQRNDHQLATAGRFASTPGVFAAFEAHDLMATMDRLIDEAEVATGAVISPFADERFTDALRAAIIAPRRPAPGRQGAIADAG